MKTFRITRYGRELSDFPLKNVISTGIEFESLPGCIPTFLEVDACIAAGYKYWGDWQELDAEQQSFLIAHYIAKRWVNNHQADAEYRAMDRK